MKKTPIIFYFIIFILGCIPLRNNVNKNSDSKDLSVSVFINDTLIQITELEHLEINEDNIRHAYIIEGDQKQLTNEQGICDYRLGFLIPREPVLMNDYSFILPFVKGAGRVFSGSESSCFPYLVRVYPDKDTVEIIQLNLFTDENLKLIKLTPSDRDEIHRIKVDTLDYDMSGNINRVNVFTLFPSNKGAVLSLGSDIINYGNWFLYRFTEDGDFVYEGLPYNFFNEFNHHEGLVYQAEECKIDFELKHPPPSFFFYERGFHRDRHWMTPLSLDFGHAIASYSSQQPTFDIARLLDRHNGKKYSYSYKSNEFKLNINDKNIKVELPGIYEVMPLLENGILYLIGLMNEKGKTMVIRIDTDTGKVIKKTFTHPHHYSTLQHTLVPHINSGRLFFTISVLGNERHAPYGIWPDWNDPERKNKLILDFFEITFDK